MAVKTTIATTESKRTREARARNSVSAGEGF